MKQSNFSFTIFFLFAVNSYAQKFNSIVSVEEVNTIAVKKKCIIKDTVVKRILIKDTVYTSNYLPDRESLKLSSLPLANIKITSGFGYRIHPILGNLKFHNGIDFSARQANIYSVLHGTVVLSSYDSIIGNFVIVNHGYYETTYGHLTLRYVKAGDLVKAGTIIGRSGCTGRVTGEHLHFIVKYKNQSINPLPFLMEVLSFNRKEQLTKFLTKISDYVN